jgi:hypothetical protein
MPHIYEGLILSEMRKGVAYKKILTVPAVHELKDMTHQLNFFALEF